jgi:D-amino peptidase
MHPADALEHIRGSAGRAVMAGGSGCLLSPPPSIEASVRYSAHHNALSNSCYPGARLLDERTVGFISDDYMDVMRFFHFVTA